MDLNTPILICVELMMTVCAFLNLELKNYYYDFLQKSGQTEEAISPHNNYYFDRKKNHYTHARGQNICANFVPLAYKNRP